MRGAAAGATGPTEDLTEPGTEVILEPGDAIFYEDDVVHTARSTGPEETVIFGTLVLTAGEPLLMPVEDMDDMATEADRTIATASSCPPGRAERGAGLARGERSASEEDAELSLIWR